MRRSAVVYSASYLSLEHKEDEKISICLFFRTHAAFIRGLYLCQAYQFYKLLEFELAYYNVAVQLVRHKTTVTFLDTFGVTSPPNKASMFLPHIGREFEFQIRLVDKLSLPRLNRCYIVVCQCSCV